MMEIGFVLLLSGGTVMSTLGENCPTDKRTTRKMFS